MATQVLAKGPLSSALGQWLFVGCGAFVLFAGEHGVRDAARDIAAAALGLATGRGDVGALLREAALHGNNAAALQNGSEREPSPQPIVIHSTTSDSNAVGWTGAILRLSVGAGACWAGYVVFANFLPDSFMELMPVTRRYFEAAVTSLGQGVLHVREVLGEQIKALGTKQDVLAKRQDETHNEVRGLREDVGDVQRHIDDIAAAISRCEGALGDAEGRQTYTSRGVGLLVRCVGDLLRADDPTVAEELDRFQEMGAVMRGGGAGGGEGGSSHRRGPVDCDLSEIGSTASTMIEDHHRQNQTVITPPPSGSKSGRAVAPSLAGLTSPPSTLKILHPFGSGRRSGGHSGSGATAATDNTSAATSSSSSCSGPENEVPRSNVAASGVDGVGDLNVDELLRIVRNGGAESIKS